ncbi:hypothetical protein ABZ436_30495 [Micromonospora matsumotoense]|uniref:hypothetical protein n=1 Tax=Micromonospora matsumotoense TaxID=121616 RepID=UPI0033F7AFEB
MMHLAYLDAGSGSLIVQAVVGGTAGAAVAAKLYWRRLASRFRRRPTDAAESAPTGRPIDAAESAPTDRAAEPAAPTPADRQPTAPPTGTPTDRQSRQPAGN